MLATLRQDLRLAWRSVCRAPGFASIAVLTLALGIGANTAIFSVVDAVLLRPLPYKDDDRLAVVLRAGDGPVAPADFLDYRAQAKSFAQMGAAEYWAPDLTDVDQPERLWALRLTAGVLPLLGVEPALGRVFAPDEDQPGRDHVAVIGYGLWQRRFAGNPQVVGSSIRLDGQPYTIVGVMPRSFMFAPFWATRAELWAPLALGPRAQDRRGQSLRVFARLGPGVRLEQARAGMAAITAHLAQQFPGTNRDVQVLALREKVVGRIRPGLLVLLGAVGLVLLMACANVAHLLLARAAARRKEMAVRLALGATRARIASQFLVESLLLALLGAGGAVLLAGAAVHALVRLAPADLPGAAGIGLDARALAFSLATAIATGLAFGVAPALQASTTRASDALRDAGRGATEGRARTRGRDLLIASEFALAVVLLVGATLMIRSFVGLQSIDPGFDPRGVLTTIVSVAGTGQAAPGRRGAFFEELVRRVDALPGVASASAINHLPLAGDLWRLPYAVEGRPVPRPGEAPSTVYRAVLPDYFRTMRQRIVRGRDIAASDRSDAPAVAIVNEAFAARAWPGEDAVGKRLAVDRVDTAAPSWLAVVAVVSNARQGQWTREPDPEIYVPALQRLDVLQGRQAYLTLVVRTRGNPAAAAPAIRELVSSIDRRVVLSEVQTMGDVVGRATAQPRFYLVLLAVFSALALGLAAAGIYGVTSYAVSRRTHEIGVRLSLGAGRADVMRAIVGRTLALAAAGGTAGLAGAVGLSRLMATLLYGVGPLDPVALSAAPLVLAATAVAASGVPVRRATGLDPAAALRQE